MAMGIGRYTTKLCKVFAVFGREAMVLGPEDLYALSCELLACSSGMQEGSPRPSPTCSLHLLALLPLPSHHYRSLSLLVPSNLA